ncbi:CRAL/TRIO domain-containing protein [Phthorimaea operculella]|nr:CRAL/TRIO domain-containing protein [Phthorimaea operculella]
MNGTRRWRATMTMWYTPRSGGMRCGPSKKTPGWRCGGDGPHKREPLSVLETIERLSESAIKLLSSIVPGTFFPRGRDIDGCLLMIIKLKTHTKGVKDVEEVKKIIIYWLDRIEREEGGQKITMFFDLDGCGLSNLDMELVKYLISLFKLYYPYFLNYIIIYNMPWVLSAAFKVVKTLLPAKAVERMRFVTKDNLKDVVPPEQALTCWGGKDDYVFRFVPEKSGDNPQKKVTFAEQDNHSPGEMLKLVPNDMILFKSENDEVSGQFVITNMVDTPISFKIRTTSPEKFRVRPSSGTLAPNASQTVIIVVQAGFQLRTVTKDRFLVMSVQIPKTDLSQKEVAEIWQNSSGSKADEYRLKCQFPESSVTKNGSLLEGKAYDKADSVTNALNNLQMNYETLNKQVSQLKIFQFLTLFMTIVAVALGYMIYKSSNEDRYCERI